MARVHSIEPIIGRNPRIIILGSMPGIISINAAQYYANPRNMFWAVLAELFGIDTDCSYQARVEQIRELPIILWDTLKACHREGSLDSKILNTEIEANDIVGLLEQHQSVQAIVFNGAASAKYFDRLITPHMPAKRNIELLKMPSTSPANAGMGFDQKIESWKELLRFI
ncbi:MAG: TDG/mug DNA glycosylase family protein [Gammaproteobacteria bacterium]|jgi:TDG/mug DNA glycosylase family protein